MYLWMPVRTFVDAKKTTKEEAFALARVCIRACVYQSAFVRACEYMSALVRGFVRALEARKAWPRVVRKLKGRKTGAQKRRLLQV